MIAACIVYPAIWAGVVAYDILYSFVYWNLWSELLVMPLTGLELMYKSSESSEELYYVFFISFLAIPFLIPVLIVLTTCLIQIVSLKRSDMGAADNQRHVTITILLLSTLFVVCNSVLSVYLMLYMLTWDTVNYDYVYWYAVLFGTILPVLNAAFNPVILISRSKAMRRGFVKALSGGAGRGERGGGARTSVTAFSTVNESISIRRGDNTAATVGPETGNRADTEV